MATWGHGPSALSFQRTMIFIDGTNLFHRLNEAKVVVTSFANLCKPYVGDRQVVHTYLYTSQHHLEQAKVKHGDVAFNGVRIVLGFGIPTSGTTPKEKGVDAQLVADLVYHAASKNMDFALVCSVDLDFAHAMRRVADFGCRTALLAIQSPAPELLRPSVDEIFEVSGAALVQQGLARSA
jgi:uncharacterized LabA/DUF88 family protein